MKSNEKQIKGQNGENLPIISKETGVVSEEIKKNILESKVVEIF